MTGWSARDLPRIRRESVQAMRHPDYVADVRRLPDADIDALTARVETATLYWVTPDMTRLAFDACQDMPDWTPAAIIPEPVGLVIWDGPLPTSTIRAFTRRGEQLCGAAWAQYGAQLHLHLVYRMPDHAVIMVAPTSVSVPMTGPTGWDSPLEHYRGPGGGRASSEYVRALHLLAATWVMMQTPTMSEPRVTRGDGWGRKSSPREREVTIVDLRALRHVRTEATDSEGREYTHRWVVRGHWRQQAHGPGRLHHRPTWIAPYVKGPAGAPLLATEHVNVWRR